MVSLLSLLFPLNLDESDQQNQSINENNKNSNILMLGKKSLCKTSLLYQMAETIAIRECDDIHFITAKTIEKLPKPVNGMPLIDVRNGHLLELVKFVHLSTYETLFDYFSEFPFHHSIPTAIIIDDISYYLNQIRRSSDEQPMLKKTKYKQKDQKQFMAQLSALLIETGNYCAKRRDGKCYTVMSLDTNQTDFMDHFKSYEMAKSIGQRFYQNIWSIEKRSDFCDQKSYEMKCDSGGSVLNVDYCLRDNQIFLNSITKTK